MKTYNERTIRGLEGAGVILGVDSSQGSSAAVSNGGQIFEVYCDDTMSHAEIIADLIRSVLKSAKVDADEVELVIGGAGPGPFTGLRVGLAAAQAFAFAVGKNLKNLISHDAVALEEYARGRVGRLRVLQDAKRKEFFVSEYDGLDEQGIVRRICGPKVHAKSDIAELPADVHVDRVSAGQLVFLAQKYQQAGVPLPETGAMYIRQPDVKQPR